MDTIKFYKKNVKMIAHRGLSGLELENTMAAFIAAGNRTYYGIECDVHKTIDGVFVIIHDDNTKRIANINKVIKESTYEQLLELNLNRLIDEQPKEYLKIPTLSEYLDNCRKYRKQCFIELKKNLNETDINKVIEIINKRNYLEESTFISFHIENLIKIRNINKDIKVQFLTSDFNDEILNLLINYNLDLDMNYQNITKEVVSKVHKANLEVNVWTVNDPMNAERLVSWGVDYITTNILE